MNELARRSARGDAVEIAARADVGRTDSEYALREHVAAAEVGQQPAVKAELAQGRLNRTDVGHGSIHEEEPLGFLDGAGIFLAELLDVFFAALREIDRRLLRGRTF